MSVENVKHGFRFRNLAKNANSPLKMKFKSNNTQTWTEISWVILVAGWKFLQMELKISIVKENLEFYKYHEYLIENSRNSRIAEIVGIT